MNQYILDTDYACKSLIELLTVEDTRLHERRRDLLEMQGAARSMFESMKRSDFTPEGIEMLFGYESAKDRIKIEVANMQTRVTALTFSMGSISGALLQIAKQGISLVHGQLASCPDGRWIGSETLKNVVWQARNQSMHYEEGRYHQNVTSCFQNLQCDFGPSFNLSADNLAYAVVDLLGWQSHTVFQQDMSILLP